VLSPGNVAECVGFDPDRRITSHAETVSAAIWRFPAGPSYELDGPANAHTDIVVMPVTGRCHHTYVGDGRPKWSRIHPAFHPNLIASGEQPRGIFTSPREFSMLHVYVPHAMVERLALESGAIKAGGSITLIDPMCAHDPLVENICRSILHEMAQPDRWARLAMDVLGQELAIRLLREHSNVSGAVDAEVAKDVTIHRDWRVRRAVDYLEAHLADDIGLDDIAAEVGLSAVHVNNLFRIGMGEPPHRYLMRRRFERARELLGNPSLSVTEIAHLCGFASSQHLATVMRKRIGTTPTAYRRGLLV
jgi:AraC family transcriptional regulator